jgi:nitroreductase
MEFDEVIRGRRSIRAYRPEPVPEQVVREILDEARWSPSWRNTQAWDVWAVSGDALERFKAEFRRAAERNAPGGLDLPVTADWPQACSARTTSLMRERAATLEAAGEPSDPAAAMARMANLFGAPWLLVFGIEDCLAEAYAGFDTGALVQSVCLAAYNRGLGSCIAATIVRFPLILRELLPNAQGKRFVVSVALGYPEPEAAANTFQRSRAPLEELVTWVK